MDLLLHIMKLFINDDNLTEQCQTPQIHLSVQYVHKCEN